MRRLPKCAWVALLSALSQPAQGQTLPASADCDALFRQAVAELASEQYARMQEMGQERMRRCPDPRSALLLGLAQANLVDGGLVSDPPAREALRKSALRHLRIAATQHDVLPSEWLMSVGEWIVHLQARGPAGEAELGDDEAGAAVSTPGSRQAESVVPPAPPPQPQPRFPWGPVLVATLGAGALVSAIALSVMANDHQAEAEAALTQLRLRADGLDQPQREAVARQIRDLNMDARAYAQVATLSWIGGGLSLVGAAAWYAFFPPQGQWRWALSPDSVRLTVRF